MQLSKVVDHVILSVKGSIEKVPVVEVDAYEDRSTGAHPYRRLFLNLDSCYPHNASQRTEVWVRSESDGIYSFKFAIREGCKLPDAIIAVWDDHNNQWRETFSSRKRLEEFWDHYLATARSGR